MRRTHRVTQTILLLAVFSTTLFVVYSTRTVVKDEVKVIKGQVWVYESDDPFDPFIMESEVLEVKDGYAKYRDKETGKVRSRSVFMLKAGAYLKEASDRSPVVIEIPGARTQRLRTPRSIGPDILITWGPGI